MNSPRRLPHELVTLDLVVPPMLKAILVPLLRRTDWTGGMTAFQRRSRPCSSTRLTTPYKWHQVALAYLVDAAATLFNLDNSSVLLLP